MYLSYNEDFKVPKLINFYNGSEDPLKTQCYPIENKYELLGEYSPEAAGQTHFRPTYTE
jgi:hypothetical protein